MQHSRNAGMLGSRKPPMSPAGQAGETGQEMDYPEEGGDQESGPPSAENQQLFDNVMANSRSFVHDPKNSERIMQAMETNDPMTVAGDQAAIILTGIFESAGRSGVEIPAEIALSSGLATIEEILEMAVSAGVIEDLPLGDEKAQMKALAAFKQGVERLGAEQAPQQEPAPQQPENPGGGGGMLSQAQPGRV